MCCKLYNNSIDFDEINDRYEGGNRIITFRNGTDRFDITLTPDHAKNFDMLEFRKHVGKILDYLLVFVVIFQHILKLVLSKKI